MNLQQTEHKVEDDYIDLHSVFLTIQGEGPFAGERAIFIRLAGCNLQCKNCDTDYTSNRHKVTVDELVEHVQDLCDHSKNHLVVITGGEPFRQLALTHLTASLLLHKFKVQIETNGTLYQKLPFDHYALTLVCSPKTPTLNRQLIPYIDVYKYAGNHTNLDPDDGLPNTQLGDNRGPVGLYRAPHNSDIYLQPLDSGTHFFNRMAQEAVVTSCITHGHKLCIQIHKIIGVE
jgi:7-carboxy-7-deazaguanine synthase